MPNLEIGLLTDEALMLSYCGGDFSAFETLYSRHSRGLYRFITWQSPRVDWADEIAQDAWMRLHNARASYLPQASFKTLLYQIARNRLIDMLRQQRPLLASDLGEPEDGIEVFDLIANDIQNDNTPDAMLMQNQRNAQLHRAIDKLPFEQKEALVLHQFSELTLSEIASLTGAKEETVKGRLRYAMQKLKQLISE